MRRLHFVWRFRSRRSACRAWTTVVVGDAANLARESNKSGVLANIAARQALLGTSRVPIPQLRRHAQDIRHRGAECGTLYTEVNHSLREVFRVARRAFKGADEILHRVRIFIRVWPAPAAGEAPYLVPAILVVCHNASIALCVRVFDSVGGYSQNSSITN